MRQKNLPGKSAHGDAPVDSGQVKSSDTVCGNHDGLLKFKDVEHAENIPQCNFR